MHACLATLYRPARADSCLCLHKFCNRFGNPRKFKQLSWFFLYIYLEILFRFYTLEIVYYPLDLRCFPPFPLQFILRQSPLFMVHFEFRALNSIGSRSFSVQCSSIIWSTSSLNDSSHVASSFFTSCELRHSSNLASFSLKSHRTWFTQQAWSVSMAIS